MMMRFERHVQRLTRLGWRGDDVEVGKVRGSNKARKAGIIMQLSWSGGQR